MNSTIQIIVGLAYNLCLIGGVVYIVGYLGWSAWWLLLLIFLASVSSK